MARSDALFDAKRLLTVNEELFNAGLRHALYLERLKTGEARAVQRFLERELFPDVNDQIARRLRRIQTRGYDTGPFTSKRLAELRDVVRGMVESGYSKYYRESFKPALNELATYEAGFVASSLTAAVPAEVLTVGGLSFNRPPTATLRSIVTSRPFEGKYVRDEWAKLGRDATARIQQQINVGVAQGEGFNTILRRVRKQTPIATRTASTIVRSSVNHVTTQARELTYRENSDIVREVRFVATLDARTTEICMSLDGKVFKIGEGPRPPMHHQCRSTTVPILASLKELGIPDAKLSATTRASMNGQVPGNVTYPQWLKSQSAAFQNDVLGPTRAKLFRQGLPIERMVGSDFRPLTLAEIAAREGLTL